MFDFLHDYNFEFYFSFPVFDDGDERTLRRTNICIMGERHFQEDEVSKYLFKFYKNELHLITEPFCLFDLICLLFSRLDILAGGINST